MTKCVLDASAILAVINSETGYEQVEALLASSLASTINIAEVLTKLVERGVAPARALEEFMQLGITVKEFNLQHAEKAAELRTITTHLGLSLGDRACLAVAIIEECQAITADRNWRELSVCQINVIR
jgi:ribonuclease VapC